MNCGASMILNAFKLQSYWEEGALNSQRVLRVTTPGLEAFLVPVEVCVNEHLGRPCTFMLKAHFVAKDIDGVNLLGRALGLAICDTNAHGEYFLHGVIQAVEQTALRNNITITIRSWFSLLEHTKNRRSFHNKNIVEVMVSVFKSHGFSDYDVSALKIRRPKIPYLVQFDESDFSFVSRLMEQAGIYYYFTYDDQSHTMHIVDSIQGALFQGKIILDNQHGFSGTHLYKWRSSRRLSAASMSTTRYDPADVFDNKAQAASEITWPLQEKNALLCYTHAAPGITAHFDAMRAQSDCIYAAINSPMLSVGCTFRIDGDEENVLYRVIQRECLVREKAYGTQSMDVVNTQDNASFESNITCLRAAYNFASDPVHVKPKISGIQMARVVGPYGQSIYMDAQGRIKIRFYWDVSNQPDSAASCWVRYVVPTAGDNFGCFTTPRVGQDVQVSFINGDPDRPMVIGVSYNKENSLAYDPVKMRRTSGIKTKSLNGHGHNELRFGDEKKNEYVYLKAQKSLHEIVGHDAQTVIKGNLQVTLEEGDHITNVERGEYMHQAGSEMHLKSHNSRVTISSSGIEIMAPMISINDAVSAHSRVDSSHEDGDAEFWGGSMEGLLGTVNSVIYPEKKKALGAGNQTKKTPSTVSAATDKIPFVDVIMDTATKKLYFLTADDWLEFSAAQRPLQKAIAHVYAANSEQYTGPDADALRRAAIDKAQVSLNATLKPLVMGPSKNTISEMLLLKGKKYTYIHSKKIKSHWRSYTLKEHDVHTVTSGSKKPAIDFKAIKAQLKKSSKLSLGGYENNYSGALCDWARRVNEHMPLHKILFDNASFNATNDARLLRYSTGLSLAGEFKPFEGIVSFSGNAAAQLTIASDAFKACGTIPNVQGWQLCFHPFGRNGRMNYERQVDFGAVRVLLDVTLSAFVGASVLASANIDVSLKHEGDPSSARLAIKGTNIRDKIAAHAKVEEAEVGGSVFAGAKAGGTVGAQLQWKNPETMGPAPKTFKGQQALAKKLKAMSVMERDSLMDWCELAAVNAGAEFACGIGVTGEFRVGYEPKVGKFILRAKAALVCGPGVSGRVGVDVDADHVVEFVKFVYYKIKHLNFSYIGFMTADAMEIVVQLFTRFIVDGLDDLKSIILKDLAGWWMQFKQEILAHYEMEDKIHAITDSILAHPSRLLYTPPEAKGRLLYLLSEQWDIGYLPRQQAACLIILSYIQNRADYVNVMQHLALNTYDKITMVDGEHRLYNALGATGLQHMQALTWFKEKVDSRLHEVIYPDMAYCDQPVINRAPEILKLFEQDFDGADKLEIMSHMEFI
jgi:type VI secretion system secreted protein VgrG